VIKIALVGCGRISHRHAELLGRGVVAEACLSAVCDVDESRARSLGEKYDVPHFTDMNQMMEAGDVDVVSVLTESGNHAEHVIELARHGRHVIVEKPMALTLDDADAMVAACDEAGVKLFVVKQNRFNLPVVKLREALEAGRFGKLVLGTVRVRWCRPQAYYDQDSWRGTWAMDGGVLTNQASHHIDLLQWMMGDVESVSAMGSTRLVDIEAEDTAVVILKFVNGALGVIEATTATRPKDLEGSLSILGEHGSAVIGGFAVNELVTWHFAPSTPDDDTVLEEFSVNPPNVYGFGHQAFYEHVVESINTNSRQLVDGIEGRKSLELISAIYESVETGREVKLRFRPKWAKLGHV
jgi:UDP-N-acetyl-2-amino-2-deoxyglucuronate dehydrogenase